MKRSVIILCLSVLPAISLADNHSFSNLSKNVYIGLGGGIIVPNDVDINVSAAATINGVALSANVSGEFEFDNGYEINGLVGYRITDYLSLETEMGYSKFDYDKVNVTGGGTATSGGVTFTGTASTSYDIDGSISSFSMIFGPMLDFDINKLKIKQISKNETYVISGPYTSVNLLKNDYIKLKNFGFEELDIYTNE